MKLESVMFPSFFSGLNWFHYFFLTFFLLLILRQQNKAVNFIKQATLLKEKKKWLCGVKGLGSYTSSAGNRLNLNFLTNTYYHGPLRTKK